MFESPCIIIYSNKSTNQMHKSLRFIACHLNTAQEPARPRPTALLSPRSDGKPEATIAVVELLMMGMMMPETRWAVFKRLVIKKTWEISASGWFIHLKVWWCTDLQALNLHMYLLRPGFQPGASGTGKGRVIGEVLEGRTGIRVVPRDGSTWTALTAA